MSRAGWREEVIVVHAMYFFNVPSFDGREETGQLSMQFTLVNVKDLRDWQGTPSMIKLFHITNVLVKNPFTSVGQLI
jgi:hypothetical protein